MATEKDPRFSIEMRCTRSGLVLGKFFPNTGLYNENVKGQSMEGMSPYVRDWKQTQSFHPIFSVSWVGLDSRISSCYQLEKAGKISYPMWQKQLHLLAMMYATDSIVQDVPALPSPKMTEAHFADVLALCQWKMNVASSRIAFPKLHVWKGAAGEFVGDLFQQLPVWIRLCKEVQDEWANAVRERSRLARKAAQDLAMKNIRKLAYEDISLRKLWNWMEVQIPSKEHADWPEMKDLFFVKDSEIHLWTPSEIETLEEIFLEFCEVGNSVSHECGKRINAIRKMKRDYDDTFEITKGEQFPELRGTKKPEKKDFPSLGAFYVAEAKWNLANRKTGGGNADSIGDQL